MLDKSWCTDRLLEAVALFLIGLLPLLIYLKKMDYSVFAPEILIIAGVIMVFSLVLRMVLIPGRTPAYVFALTAMAVLVVDIQTDWITTIGLRLVLNFALFGALFWFLCNHLPRVVLIVMGAMVLVTALMPSEKSASDFGQPSELAGDNEELPFVLHLILDEHIGIEGIPAEFDPEQEYASRIRDFYLEKSFTVFGRAYSRYNKTRYAISSLLNFDGTADPAAFLDANHQRGGMLKNNLWFDVLREYGYRIHALESDYLKFIDPVKATNNQSGDTYSSYNVMSIKPIENANVTAWQKVPFILSSYMRLSWILHPIISRYTDLAFSDLGSKLHLPQWDLQGTFYPVNLASFQALDLFTEQLHHAGPGQAYFAHIQLPHYPYGLDQDCSLELRPGYWYECFDRTVTPKYNTDETRALRYPRYLNQIICLLSRLEMMFQVLVDKGLWEDAIIIVHGDHGSRISNWAPNLKTKDDLTPSDYMDIYSTLFAVKLPTIEPGYDRQLLPIDHLFKRLVRDGTAPADSVLENNPSVYILNGTEMMLEQPLVEFANGKPGGIRE